MSRPHPPAELPPVFSKVLFDDEMFDKARRGFGFSSTYHPSDWFLFLTVDEQGTRLQRSVFISTILSIESVAELHHTFSKGDHIIALYIVS